MKSEPLNPHIPVQCNIPDCRGLRMLKAALWKNHAAKDFKPSKEMAKPIHFGCFAPAGTVAGVERAGVGRHACVGNTGEGTEAGVQRAGRRAADVGNNSPGQGTGSRVDVAQQVMPLPIKRQTQITQFWKPRKNKKTDFKIHRSGETLIIAKQTRRKQIKICINSKTNLKRQKF